MARSANVPPAWVAKRIEDPCRKGVHWSPEFPFGCLHSIQLKFFFARNLRSAIALFRASCVVDLTYTETHCARWSKSGKSPGLSLTHAGNAVPARHNDRAFGRAAHTRSSSRGRVALLLQPVGRGKSTRYTRRCIAKRVYFAA